MKNFSPYHYGFTLIELMIVVAIIAILAGIAYPNTRLMANAPEELKVEQHFWIRQH